MAKEQNCSTHGCSLPAAFSTRTKPAWCHKCLAGILSGLGLDPAEGFTSPKTRWLTRCRSCAAECHYLLEYLLELRTRDEPACRRCYWRAWAEKTNRYPEDVVPVGADEVRQHLDHNGFDPVEEVLDLPNPSLPVLTRCRLCSRQEAKRLGDIGWGCTCRSNPAPRGPAPAQPRRTAQKDLLVDSGSPALKWWDYEVNSPKELQTLTSRSRREAAWVGQGCGHRFVAQVFRMAQIPACPQCGAVRRALRDAEFQVESERFRRTPVADVPELLAAWADVADPAGVMVSSHRLARFECEKGHHPRATPRAYLRSGCQFCRRDPNPPGQQRMLRSVLPEIAEQWHPTRNSAKHTPDTVLAGSKRTIWWLADCCGYEWQEPVESRNKYKRQRCPRCRTILGSFAWTDPGLAAEWAVENPLTPWHLRPTGQTNFLPQWVCSVNPEHRWEAPLASRSAGAGCPECREAGKSRVELEHLEAAGKVFEKVRSGALIRDPAFTTRKSWTVDILVGNRGAGVAIEYDGAYWHAPQAKRLVDVRKSQDLLAAGYLVVRLREDGLPSLDITHERYLELDVHSAAPQPEKVIAAITQWIAICSPAGRPPTQS